MTAEKIIEFDDRGSGMVACEEFLLHLHRSAELVKADKIEEAKRAVDAAFESQPSDPAGLATMGLVCFHIGLYPRAIAILERLVAQSPKEPRLRLNLALVYLKAGRTIEARGELHEALHMDPEYRKAYGYLGLACLRLGDQEAAEEAFRQAGAGGGIQRMDHFSTPDCQASPFAQGEHGAGTSEHPVAAGTGRQHGDMGGWVTLTAANPLPLSHNSQNAGEPVAVADLVSQARLPIPLDGGFLVNAAGYLVMEVKNKGFARLDGLHFCISPGLAYRPLKRRQKGHEVEELFGSTESPVFEIEGSGRLGFHPRDAVFTAVTLDDETAYIREEFVFAFDRTVGFENGRLPGVNDPLVNFSGRGAVALRTPVAPFSLEVTPDQGVVVPAGGLVGWFGRLLPRPARGGPFDPSLNSLELSGEGVLLFCLR
ncbi:MAG: tetratricopeptide repeat protein [Deltaproteobacteria bacterium]|nr:tetratricopeptide repeat protein [Deltaproteobacteria bacterium]